MTLSALYGCCRQAIGGSTILTWCVRLLLATNSCLAVQCDQFPPAEGDFLELCVCRVIAIYIFLTFCSRPAGGSFTVEIADNRAVTSLSYNGQYVTEWGDGQSHPEDYSVSSCITSPNSEYRLLAL